MTIVKLTLQKSKKVCKEWNYEVCKDTLSTFDVYRKFKGNDSGINFEC